MTAESENLEAVRRGYDAFNRDGIAAILEMFDPEIEWQTDSGTPEADTHRGIDDVREYIEGVVDPFENLRIELADCIPRGNQVLAELQVRGQVKGTGIEFDPRWWHLWTIHALKGVHVHVFFDRARALEAMQARAKQSQA